MTRFARALRVTGVMASLRLLVLLVVVACGGSDTPPPDAPPPDPTAARIEIRPGSQTLTQDRRSAELTAVVFDADGNEIPLAVTWRSSARDQISVDENGVVTGVRPLGSAAIWAETDTALSMPTLVASVELAPGTLALLDAQIVHIGTPVARSVPPAEDDGSSELEVRLRDVAAPAPGTVVVPLEAKPVGGVVLTSSVEGDEVVVRLRSAPLTELYAAYSFDWTLGLEDFPIVMDGEEDALVPYERTLERNFPPSGTSAFQCTGAITAYLDRNSVDLQLVGGAKFIYKSSKRDPSLPDGYLKIAIEGPLTIKGTLALRVKAGFKASAQCEITGRIAIPLGAFSLAVLPRVPLGVGVNVNADINVSTFELGFSGENGFDLGVGFECPGGDLPCHGLSKFQLINRFKPVLNVPTGSTDDIKSTLTGQAYFLSGLEFLIALGRFDFKAVKATFGPVQTGTFSSVRNQADNRSYASDYTLDIQGKLEPGDGVNKAIKTLLGKNTQDGRLGLEITVADEISKSPRGEFAASKTRTGVNSPVSLTFNLTETDYFLLGYNVKGIVIYKKHEDAPGYEKLHEIEVTASNQTRFQWDWRPKEADLGQNELFAFVKTSLPVIELELGDDASKKIEVANICDAVSGVLPAGCEITGSMSWRMVTTTPTGGSTSTANASVTMQQDTSSPEVLLFRPYGTWSATHGGSFSGCTVTVQPNPASGLMSGASSQGVIRVVPDPEGNLFYDGLVATGPYPVTTTMTCPGSPPFVQEQMYDFNVFKVLETQNLMMDPVTRRAMGSYQEMTDDGAGSTTLQTWTWDLTLSADDPM